MNRSGYVLDTNVVSETRKPRAHPKVIAFLREVEPASLFISVRRRNISPDDVKLVDALEAWVATIETAFADRLLAIDAAVARLWGELSADRTRPVIDTLIAPPRGCMI